VNSILNLGHRSDSPPNTGNTFPIDWRARILHRVCSIVSDDDANVLVHVSSIVIVFSGTSSGTSFIHSSVLLLRSSEFIETMPIARLRREVQAGHSVYLPAPV